MKKRMQDREPFLWKKMVKALLSYAKLQKSIAFHKGDFR